MSEHDGVVVTRQEGAQPAAGATNGSAVKGSTGRLAIVAPMDGADPHAPTGDGPQTAAPNATDGERVVWVPGHWMRIRRATPLQASDVDDTPASEEGEG